jgi:hypothetical protein
MWLFVGWTLPTLLPLIESSESAYQDYQKGLDSGILLEEFKDQINCSSGVI